MIQIKVNIQNLYHFNYPSSINHVLSEEYNKSCRVEVVEKE